jgi:RES domain
MDGAFLIFAQDETHRVAELSVNTNFADCLNPDGYATSQALGLQLLTSGPSGIVYPSVPHNGGTYIGCFRPPLVLKVREGASLTLTFAGSGLKGTFWKIDFTMNTW